VVPKIVAKIALHAKLSIRERQVTALVIRGKLNKEIAFELHLTEGTVKEYMNRIFRKLGIANRVTLAMWALTSPEAQEQGLTSPEAEQ
jgi:DNA-binding NarL/FixJ family response regulator